MGGMANHESFEVQDLVNGELTAKRDAGGFSSEVYADAAVDFIQKADSDQPFFLYVAFMAPHDTRNPPEQYRQICENQSSPAVSSSDRPARNEQSGGRRCSRSGSCTINSNDGDMAGFTRRQRSTQRRQS
jgi:hypothetical protein